MKEHPRTSYSYIQCRGSDTVLAIIQKIAADYMKEFPSVRLPLLGGGTSRGYKCILDKTTNIGMVSSPMSPDMKKWAKKQPVDLQYTLIAYDGLVAIVHASNPIANLSLDQLHDVFTGKVTDWKALGWEKGGPIHVYSQDPGRGGYEPWKRIVAGENGFITLKATVINGSIIYKSVQEDPAGIGYVGLITATKMHSKILSVNSIVPSVETIHEGTYPIRRELALVSAKGETNQEIERFLAYCMNPAKGQTTIEKMGIVHAHAGEKS